ncbi:MAG: hypothetical protein JWO05_1882 [Gemmatimonadetes bacterium]|nr:hypothetical protein [Gemmatimonadota bacterium]
MSTPAVIRWQIVAPDAAGTASFYQKLFGWELSQDNAMGYRELKGGSNGIDGGVWPGPPQQDRAFVQLTISVPDVKAYVAKAEGMGAKVIVPPSMLPDGDEMAVLLDPASMPFIVVKLG